MRAAAESLLEQLMSEMSVPSSIVTCGLRSWFFVRAEDGIRDVAVTGVQTCALPIWRDVRDLWWLDGQARSATRRPTEGIRPKAPEQAVVLVPVAEAGTFGEPLEEGGNRVGPVRIWRGREPAGEPQVAQQDHEHDHEGQGEQPGLRTDARPEHRVVADALVPDGVGPEVEDEATKGEQQEDREEDE